MNLHPRKFPILGFLQEGVSLGFLPFPSCVSFFLSQHQREVSGLQFISLLDPEALIGGFPPLSLRPWRNGCGPFKGEAPA